MSVLAASSASPPCPVDCIDMVETPVNPNTWRWPDPAHLDLKQVNQP